VVVGDFGLSKMLVDAYLWKKTVDRNEPKGTYRWMAPELLDERTGPHDSTRESDVYAFGLTAWVTF
jgi:serine/threonine protein kinase